MGDFAGIFALKMCQMHEEIEVEAWAYKLEPQEMRRVVGNKKEMTCNNMRQPYIYIYIDIIKM